MTPPTLGFSFDLCVCGGGGDYREVKVPVTQAGLEL